jgi:hypothetical protein
MTTTLKVSLFTCALCGETFRETSTPEQTRAEYENTWGRPWKSEETDSLCDDCYGFALTRLVQLGQNPGGRA